VTDAQNNHLFDGMKVIRTSYPQNVVISHLNVNSISNKHTEVKELIATGKLDILVLSETKLDESYQQSLFEIEGYSIARQDKRSNSGGLLTYISNDIPFTVSSPSICNDEIECMTIELIIAEQKLLLVCVYKNPRMENGRFRDFFDDMSEKIFDSHDNVVIIGDMNFNMFSTNTLSALLPTFGLTNIISEATCFKASLPTLIDVMLVSKRRKYLKGFSVDTGISDFHNLIGGVLRLSKPLPKTKKVSFRQTSKIDYSKVLFDLDGMDLVGAVDQSDSAEEAFNTLHNQLHALLDKHAPKKTRIIRRTDFHCMTKELRKAILIRNQLRNKYYKWRSSHYLALYRSQRNIVTSIKRREIRKYFEEKCKSGSSNKDFWKAIKPFFSKSRTKSDSIPLREGTEIITEERTVCNIFNEFFQKIGNDIGTQEDNEKPLEEIVDHYENHESICLIRDRIYRGGIHQEFLFRFVSETEVSKTIKSLSVNKAVGYDEISTRFIKSVVHKLARPITQAVNRCILENIFPSTLKKANISPVYKKKDKLNKDNFRSVNILPIISKIMERLMYNQMYEHMTSSFHDYLSGFRKGYGCQDILIRMTEDWREALDKGDTIGVVAIDLSKAFDCMPHGLLLAKLSAYGFSTDALELLKSYIMKRQQRVKIGETYSDWVFNIKGVPQGSILGPLLFNIFINDFLYSNFNSKIYNYADDNTLCCFDRCIASLKERLQLDCVEAMRWFELNKMRANANKFQLMFLHKSNENSNESLRINDIALNASQSINVLGVELDKHLNFNLHTDGICGQAGKQINAMKRINNYLDKKCRLTLYNSYIASNFNYCPVIWMFTGRVSFNKVERTNKRALRFVTNDEISLYEDICSQEKLFTVYRQCVKTVAVMMYKVKNGTAPAYIRELFNSQESPYNMRDSDKFILPTFKTVRYGKKSFRYFGARLWGNIPIIIKESRSLNTFKREISKWLLTCSMHDIE